MAWREWPLVAFTLLGQLATGIYLFLVLPAVSSGRPLDGVIGPGPLLPVLGGVLALLGLAAAASLFHLGRPLMAPNSLANLRTSWLSREILFELLFIFFLAVLAVLLWRGGGEGWPAVTAAGLAAVCGILFLLCMARLYMVPGVPAWNTAATPFSFFLATVVLGSLGALAVGRLTARASVSAAPDAFVLGVSWARLLPVIAAALIALSVVGHILLAPDHGLWGRRASASLKPSAGSPGLFFVLRLALLAGGGAATLAALRSDPGGGAGVRGGVSLAWVAFGLAAASELLARFGFYSLGAGRR